MGLVVSVPGTDPTQHLANLGQGLQMQRPLSGRANTHAFIKWPSALACQELFPFSPKTRSRRSDFWKRIKTRRPPSNLSGLQRRDRSVRVALSTLELKVQVAKPGTVALGGPPAAMSMAQALKVPLHPGTGGCLRGPEMPLHPQRFHDDAPG